MLDASNLRNLTLLSSYPAGDGQATGVAILGSTVFVAAGSGLQVLDASNLRNLTLLSTYPAGDGQATGVAVLGSTVFVAAGSGLQVLDASNLRNLTLLSTYPADLGEAYVVAVSGSTVFVADGYAGLQVLNASNPRNLTLLSTYKAGSGLAFGVSVSGSTVFVADFSAGLQVLDASNPRDLILLSTYPPGSGSAWGVTVSGSTVFVADGSAGLQVLDASNPRNLILLSTYPASSGYAFSAAVSGSTVFVAAAAGLQVLDMSQQILMGIPSQGDVGNYKLELVATDSYGGNISAPFTIRVEGPPQIHGRIPLQYAPIGQVFHYFIPQGLITDPNNDPISFGAQLTDTLSLLPWLSFNPVAAIFMGTPGVSDGGTFNISLSSTDNIAGFTNTSFILFAGQPIPMSSPFYQGRFFNVSIPSVVFNVSGVIFTNYTALQSDRSALPSWLQFIASQLRFEGTPPVEDQTAYVLNLMVVAGNDRGDKIQAPLSFQIISNAFFQVSPPSIQTATTGTDFRFVANTIFNRPNGYPLVYSASQAEGSPLPVWLYFNATEPPMFYGKPGYSDTDFYAARLLQIRFNASDGVVSGTSLITISVGGTSWGQFAVLVGSPIISFLAALYSLYKLRGFVLNRCGKQRYQKGTIEIEAGETLRLTLKTPADAISEVAVRLPAKKACSRCCQFFKLPETLSGNTLLPSWLTYDPEKRELRTKRTIPLDIAGQQFVIQVCNDDKVIIEEYTLKVVSKLMNQMSIQVDDDEPTTTTSDNKAKKRIMADKGYLLQNDSASHLPSITETQGARFYQLLPSQETSRQPVPTGERRCILQ